MILKCALSLSIESIPVEIRPPRTCPTDFTTWKKGLGVAPLGRGLPNGTPEYPRAQSQVAIPYNKLNQNSLFTCIRVLRSPECEFMGS